MRIDVYFSRSGRDHVIEKALGVSPESLEISPGGKPYIPNGREFNISHSGKIAVCAVSDIPVGVDIELMKIRDTSRIAKAFTKAEAERVQMGGLSEFYRTWTIKEAVGKLRGEGVSRMNLKEIDGADPGVFAKSFICDNEYMLSVCAEKMCDVAFYGDVSTREL